MTTETALPAHEISAATSDDLPFIRDTVARLRLDGERLEPQQFVVVRREGAGITAFGRIKPYRETHELGSVAVVEDERGWVVEIFRQDVLVQVFRQDELAAELMPVLCEEIRRLPDSLTEEEVRRARTQLKAATLMSMESTGSRAEQMGEQVLIYGRPIPVAEIVQRIDA
ncbi:hypothetical protein LCGC14_2876620, partial [marine sediment metagenome]